MTPGRELDALVAERVMGRVLPESGEDRAWMIAFLPHYSTNIAAAWDVVEKFHAITEIRIYSIQAKSWYVYIDTYLDDAYATQETLPHAICIAALRAKGVQI